MSEKKTFVLRMSYAPILAEMTNEQAGQLMKAIFSYVSTGKGFEELKEPGLQMAAKFIKQDLDVDLKNYFDRCKKNAENGKKGGKNKANANEKSERKQSQTKKANANEKSERKPNDNDCDNDCDNELENKFSNKTPLPPLKEFSNKPLGKPFIRWLDYKKQVKQSYKSQMSVEECYNRLERLSGGDVVLAEKIVNQSIAQGWKGLFELKETGGQKNEGTDYNRSPDMGKYAGFGRKISG